MSILKKSKEEILNKLFFKDNNSILNKKGKLMDMLFPLKEGTHCKVKKYEIESGKLIVILENGLETELFLNDLFVTSSGFPETPNKLILKNIKSKSYTLIELAYKNEKTKIKSINFKRSLVDCFI